MTIVAERYAYVIGVDTHSKTHTLVVVKAASGAVVDSSSFPVTTAGLARAVSWIGRRTGGDADTLVVIEGIGSYGASFARMIAESGLNFCEGSPTPPALRQGRGKSDPIDAELIARSVLGIEVDRLRQPRQDDGIRAGIRVLVSARDALSSERIRLTNELNALVRIAPLGLDARKALSTAQINLIAAWRNRDENLEVAIARKEARRLARRVQLCDEELSENTRELRALVEASTAASLLDERGIGPVNAAIVLSSWSHPGRVRNEAAFASLGGVAPIPASSGNTARHRLNRGGDRRLNRALYAITVSRMIHDPVTREYAERRQSEGRTKKEIRRCLKRYISRNLYRTLNRNVQAPIGT